MTDSNFIPILLREDPEIVQQLDERAKREGTDRTKLIRRFIRYGLSLPLVPAPENLHEAATEAA